MQPRKKRRGDDHDGNSGLSADGEVLVGAKAVAFDGCGVDAVVEASEPLYSGTMDEFAKERQRDAALQQQLRNTVKKCRACSKVCGLTLMTCNSCGAELPKEVTYSHNVFMGFIYGVHRAPFPLQISIRRQTPELLVFDDLLALSPCHLNAIPTYSYIPDWRFLLRKPDEGLRLIAMLEEALWECVSSQFLQNEAWGKKMLRDGPARTRQHFSALRSHVVAGCNHPPSQVGCKRIA